MESPDWNDLRYFLAVARTGGLTGAARKLGSSQSTVSRHIETLERALRVRLFERRPDGYALTEAGQSILAKAESVEGYITDLAGGVAGRDTQPFGTVRLATIESLAHCLILPSINLFREHYPEIRLELSTQVGHVDLPGRETDIALRLSRPETGPYAIKKLGAVGFGLYASKAYLNRHPVRSDQRRLKVHTVLGWPDDQAFTVMAKLLRRWTTDAPALTLDSVSSHCRAASEGLGLTVVPCLMADSVGTLTRIDRERFHHAADLWLIVHSDIRNAARVRSVITFLTSLVQRQRRKVAGEPTDREDRLNESGGKRRRRAHPGRSAR